MLHYQPRARPLTHCNHLDRTLRSGAVQMFDSDYSDHMIPSVYLPRPFLTAMASSAPSSAPFIMTVQSALELVRENEDGVICPEVATYLENQLDTIIKKLQASPTSYSMDKDEFAVFNYYRYRYEDAEFTQSAISRFWNAYSTPKSKVVLDHT